MHDLDNDEPADVNQVPPRTPGVTKLGPGSDRVGLTSRPVRRPAPGQALVEVLAAGICGTDLHIIDDEFPSVPPVTMGHEVAGTVVAVGHDSDAEWVGRRAATETYFSWCGTCRYCRDGRTNLCAQRRSIGSHVDGGFARWLVVPVVNLHEVPDHVTGHAAALCEPLACVTNCLCDPNIVNPGDTVLVTGPGAMGILAAQVARAAGGSVHVVGTERDAGRLDVARSLGFATSLASQWPADRAARGEHDVGIECSGNAAGAGLCLRAVRPGGRYVQVGIFGREVPVLLDLVLYREIAVTSGFASTPRSWQRAMQLLAARAVELSPLVTGVVPLAQWERAFAATREARGMKWVMDPRPEAPSN